MITVINFVLTVLKSVDFVSNCNNKKLINCQPLLDFINFTVIFVFFVFSICQKFVPFHASWHMLFKSICNCFFVVLSSLPSGIFLVLSSWYVSFAIPTKRHSTSSGWVIKRVRFSIHDPYIFLDFSDCTAAKPSVSHD